MVDRYDGIDKDPEGAFVYYQDYREIEAICEGLDSYAAVCVANVQRLESRVRELEAERETLTDPERKLNAWIKAARELALSCGMPEDEERTTRYIGYVTKELSTLRARHAALVEAAELKRNVIIRASANNKIQLVTNLVGNWIAIPEEDFNKLKAALAEVKG